jgi:AraC family transcriptional regulator
MAGQDALMRHLMSVFEVMCVDASHPYDSEFAVAAGRVLTGRLLKLHTDGLRRGDRDGRLSPAQQRSLSGYFEANLHRGIGVDELLPIVSLSKTHFIRLFTRTYGMPPVRYHLLLRLKKAEDLLIGSDHPILDAVHAFGFSDQSHFNRAFLKYLNYRPGALLRIRSNPTQP